MNIVKTIQDGLIGTPGVRTSECLAWLDFNDLAGLEAEALRDALDGTSVTVGGVKYRFTLSANEPNAVDISMAGNVEDVIIRLADMIGPVAEIGGAAYKVAADGSAELGLLRFEGPEPAAPVFCPGRKLQSRRAEATLSFADADAANFAGTVIRIGGEYFEFTGSSYAVTGEALGGSGNTAVVIGAGDCAQDMAEAFEEALFAVFRCDETDNLRITGEGADGDEAAALFTVTVSEGALTLTEAVTEAGFSGIRAPFSEDSVEFSGTSAPLAKR